MHKTTNFTNGKPLILRTKNGKSTVDEDNLTTQENTGNKHNLKQTTEKNDRNHRI